MFRIDGRQYYMSFYECERSTNTINLLPMAIDGVLESKEMGPLLEDSYTSRYGKWYILIEVHDEEFNDCLSPRYEYRDQVEGFLNDLYDPEL
ncbi:hypothetical protein MQE36_09925 [Zhouia spongiae]|uniref:Uncharacterized protein n=1 Tax=Zhouia spongiae TaxID=2202721 RepID=A0ABY3YIG2_9FLAO|nr:hypothetical protein [Zhouia spongiae]UNY97412.1 hypothetical protein MQE36_09925 [Zhouia spongiae]